ncbi:MAG: hypothetical protein J0H41_17645 [Rhizobiales bacterium]|nr:hypothetical protein [Hyphomicrobiales bacterium]
MRDDLPRRAFADQPTLSLLRLSAAQRLLGAGVALAALWAAAWWAMG